jgi:hypothetical protein
LSLSRKANVEWLSWVCCVNFVSSRWSFLEVSRNRRRPLSPSAAIYFHGNSAAFHDFNAISMAVQKTLFHSTFFIAFQAAQRRNCEISSGFESIFWLNGVSAWRTNQMKINKHFELGNYWLRAVAAAAAAAVDCLPISNQPAMNSHKKFAQNKPRSVINSSIRRCFLRSTFPLYVLWTRQRSTALAAGKEVHNLSEVGEKLMAIKQRNTLNNQRNYTQRTCPIQSVSNRLSSRIHKAKEIDNEPEENGELLPRRHHRQMTFSSWPSKRSWFAN